MERSQQGMNLSVHLDFSEDTPSDPFTVVNRPYFLLDDESSRDSGYGSPSLLEGSSQLTPEPEDVADLEPRKNFNFPSVKRTLFSVKQSAADSEDEDPKTIHPKRRRLEHDGGSILDRTVFKEEVTSDTMKQAVDDLENDTTLIGDGSQNHRLPTVEGRHGDIKSVSAHTVCQLLTGKYDDVISGFQIIDCRYPYEYEGGHIKTAINLCTSREISELLTCLRGSVSTDGNILVFHCEFSSVRAPKLLRHLRSEDRKLNMELYPFLYYPEVYLLGGGYSSFFHQFKHLCQPMEYLPMKQRDYTSELRHFRSTKREQARRKNTSARTPRDSMDVVSPCVLQL